MAQQLLEKAKEPNVIQALVEIENLRTKNAQQWVRLDAEQLFDFPILTLDFIKNLTVDTEEANVNVTKLIKLPPFWRENPMLWFAQVEAGFALSQITSDESKFRESKLRRLLQGLDLGEERPSYCLQRLRNLAAGQCSHSVLRTLFLERLPDPVRGILAANDTADLVQLALQADEIMDYTRGAPRINAVNSLSIPDHSTEIAELHRRIEELTRQPEHTLTTKDSRMLLPFKIWKQCEEMSTTMCLAWHTTAVGKLNQPNRIEASGETNQAERCLIITDATSGMRYLVDLRADVSVLPRKAARENSISKTYQLFAANGSTIATYGEKLIAVDLGRRRKYEWIFIVANVTQAILGADFFTHHNLMIDLR
ncbi:uncharacterized protein LOC114930298 [Nylanderia fulva]|uniref:uncharacterized protein LOC114930298 n=1 Tax=Nylanderia fulva TaxID=613905 RepID=UPI0010FBA79C|nr:uncharacterized protein LOC114930298 [Nylanderia fulva]